jgi:hypothetical protein
MEENNMKKKLSPNAKKSLIVVGSAIICIGAIAAILSFSTGATTPDAASSAPASSAASAEDISIGEISLDSSVSSDAKTFVPSSDASGSTELTKIEKPTSTPPKPVIEGDASTASDGTVTPPTNPALTNKNAKPTYTTPPTASSKSSSSKSSNSTSSKSSSSSGKSSGGSTTGGSDPVFGNKWGTGGQGTVVSGMKEDGIKEGTMD